MKTESAPGTGIFRRMFPGESVGRSLYLFLMLLGYCLVAVLGMSFHEMWRDELELWLVGSCSNTPADVFRNAELGPNPYLWTLLLHFLSKISLNPVMVQVAHLLFATGAAYIFLRFSPFSIIQKFLFCFGYYALYEYAIISRGYAMTVFFLFLFCALFRKYRVTGIPLAVIIFFLANGTGGFGVIFSISLLIFLISNYYFEEKRVMMGKQNLKYLICSIFLIVLSIWIAIRSMSPPEESVYAAAWFTHFDSNRCVEVLWRIWYGFFPVPHLSSLEFWNSNILMDVYWYPSITWYLTAFSVFILVVNVLIFSRRVPVLLFYLSGTAGILLLNYFQSSIFYINASRYHGFLFIIFIVSLWLLAGFPERESSRVSLPVVFAGKSQWRAFQKYFLFLFLAINFFAGAVAYYKDCRYPFSAAEVAGKYIVSNKLEKYPTAGFIDCTVSPTIAYTRCPIYYLDRDTASTFPIWTTKKHSTDREVMLERLGKYISKQNDTVLLVLNSELNEYLGSDISLTPLISFKDNIVKDENLYVYLIKRKVP